MRFMSKDVSNLLRVVRKPLAIQINGSRMVGNIAMYGYLYTLSC